MKKNMKKILTFSVFILLFGMFAMNFVAADTVTDSVRNLFSKWEGGTDTAFNTSVAKYLFWALVSMVIYSVALNIPGLKTTFKDKDWLAGLFSIIVGFLSMMYITPGEVYALMTSYSALGFVIGGAIPFLILVAFTFTLASDTGATPGQMLAHKAIAYVMWIAFALFILIKIGTSADVPTPAQSLTYWVLFGVSMLIIIFLAVIFKKFGHEIVNAGINKYNEMTRKQTWKLKADVQAIDTATGDEAVPI